MAYTNNIGNTAADTEIDLINKAREDKGISINALADRATIPYKTLCRRLDGDGLLTLLELRKIAAAIGVAPSTLLPDTLKDTAA